MMNQKDLLLEYNSARPKLNFTEYGRGIQQMVDYAKSLPEKEDRNNAVNTIISALLILNPQLRDQPNSKQKLWDHIFMMADYDLDVDSPFPIPEKAEELSHPEKPSYGNNRIKYRYYGKYTKEMLEQAAAMEEGEKKTYFLNTMASFMKMAFRIWNDEKAPDHVVIDHMKDITGEEINITEISEIFVAGNSYQNRRSNNNNYSNNNRNKKNNKNNKYKKFRKK